MNNIRKFQVCIIKNNNHSKINKLLSIFKCRGFETTVLNIEVDQSSKNFEKIDNEIFQKFLETFQNSKNYPIIYIKNDSVLNIENKLFESYNSLSWWLHNKLLNALKLIESFDKAHQLIFLTSWDLNCRELKNISLKQNPEGDLKWSDRCNFFQSLIITNKYFEILQNNKLSNNNVMPFNEEFNKIPSFLTFVPNIFNYDTKTINMNSSFKKLNMCVNFIDNITEEKKDYTWILILILILILIFTLVNLRKKKI